MCGICGIANAKQNIRPIEPDRIEAMCSQIAHRGPDGAGIHIAEGVGLGHRRLSIIDRAGGSQPLANETGDIWVTYNGEIYNYQDLRTDLSRRGHQFRTRSDTEVLVHAYEQYGDAFVEKLDGMFAFAIHDQRSGRVLLGRDRLGIKPLFYTVADGALFFASEVKAVLVGSGLPARTSDQAVQEYLMFRYVAGKRTFFEGIHRLEPGHLAAWEGDSLRVWNYWSPQSTIRGPSMRIDDAVDAIDTVLRSAVDSQMMSEVPLGTFCSGGVDSGLVTAYAAKSSPHRLHTFSVGFEDPRWDESRLAETTAAQFGTDHRILVSRADDFLGLLPSLTWFNDEPLSHPNAVSLFQLSQFARKSVTVVLTGEGADELYCGYPRYHLVRANAALQGIPDVGRRSLRRLLNSLPGHRAGKLGEQIARPSIEALLLNSAYVLPEIVERLTSRPVEDALSERRRLLMAAEVDTGDVIDTLSRYELLTYLGCALDRMDRMSMAAGVEGRVPFLDERVVELALRLPTSTKIGLRTNKRALKLLAKRKLHADVARRPKSGFGIPLDDWFRSTALAPLRKRIMDRGHPAYQHFDSKEIARLVMEHEVGSWSHGETLWLIANVFVWYDTIAPGAASSPTMGSLCA